MFSRILITWPTQGNCYPFYLFSYTSASTVMCLLFSSFMIYFNLDIYNFVWECISNRGHQFNFIRRVLRNVCSVKDYYVLSNIYICGLRFTLFVVSSYKKTKCLHSSSSLMYNYLFNSFRTICFFVGDRCNENYRNEVHFNLDYKKPNICVT